MLEDVFSKSTKVKRVAKEMANLNALQASFLYWNPVRPALGPGDYLERVFWARPGNGTGRQKDRIVPAIARYFEKKDGQNWSIKQSFSWVKKSKSVAHRI